LPNGYKEKQTASYQSGWPSEARPQPDRLDRASKQGGAVTPLSKRQVSKFAEEKLWLGLVPSKLFFTFRYHMCSASPVSVRFAPWQPTPPVWREIVIRYSGAKSLL